MEIFHPVHAFHVGLHIETVQKFGAGLMGEIVESPVRLRIEFAQRNILQPPAMPRRYFRMIERYLHTAVFEIERHLKSPVGTLVSANRLAETLFALGIFLAGLFVTPTVFFQNISGTNFNARGDGSIWKSVVSDRVFFR